MMILNLSINGRSLNQKIHCKDTIGHLSVHIFKSITHTLISFIILKFLIQPCFRCSSTDPNPRNCSSIADQINRLCYHVVYPDISLFHACIKKSKIDVTTFAESCKYDVCYNYPSAEAMKRAACSIYQTLATQCWDLGIFVSWKEETGCGEFNMLFIYISSRMLDIIFF